MQLAELQPKPQTLNFNGHEFTMIFINGEIYFNANEVANTLEFANPRDAVANHVDSDDVALADTLTNGGVQKQKFINESGLYALIFASKKPSAKDFKKWVTKEVIPSIRKTGSYSLQPQIALPNFADPVQAARAWADAMELQQKAIAQVAELQPKAQALDAITHAKGNSNIRDTAKALGAKQSDFISWCLKHGWLYRDDCERLKAYANRIQQGFISRCRKTTDFRRWI